MGRARNRPRRLAARTGAGGFAERRRRNDPAQLAVSGRRARLRLPKFSRNGEPRQRADQAALDCAQGGGRGAVARMRSLGRTRRTDCADRRGDRLGRRAIATPAGQPRQGPDRRRRGRWNRHHLQRSGRRRAVCAGDRAPGRDRARQSDIVAGRDCERGGLFARGYGRRSGLSNAGVRDAQLLGAAAIRHDGRVVGCAGRRLHPVLQCHRRSLPQT